MAINTNIIRRPSDRNLFLAAATLFPLLVFIGYFRTYYFSAFFDVQQIPNALVHIHGIVMSLWVVYFTVQVSLIRSKNIKLHMTLGFAGIALAAIVAVVCLATAYDSHIIRRTSVVGVDPHSFFIIPLFDLTLFILFFASAIYYRKRPAEHKSLMLLTALNFLAPAIGRIPVPIPEKYLILWIFGLTDLIVISCLAWFTIKHRKLNKVFLLGALILIISHPLRLTLAFSEIWLRFVDWIVS